MWKIIFKITIALVVAALLVGGYFLAMKVRKQFLLFAIGSNELFHGQAVSFDYKKQQITSENFSSSSTEMLKLGKVLLNYDFVVKGKVFPSSMISDFIEINSNAILSLDLRDNKINGMSLADFNIKINQLIQELSINNPEYANLKINCNFSLVNFKGEKKDAPAVILVSKLTDGNYLFALNFDKYMIKSFIDHKNELIFGEYSAYQKDFEFIDFNFGLPNLFHLNSNELIVGNFKYDFAKKNFEFITGESKFPRESTIKGSIFSLHGLSHGTIAWEYFNKNRWKVTLNDAVVISPLRARLTDLVFSQDDEGFNGINFNGEIEFYHNAFKDILGFEQPRNSALLKHHLIGKWDLDTNCWELNRLNHSAYAPLIKAKYRNFDLLFNPGSFKLSGAGEKSENISFSYELIFDNAELKKDENYLIAYAGKLSGDCELKIGADNTFEPFFKGSLNFGTVDGQYNNFKYSGNNLKLQFGEDRDDKNAESWQISANESSIKSPDLPLMKLQDLTGNIKLFKSNNSDDLNTMIYLNLAGSKMDFGKSQFARPAIEGGLNLLPNLAIWKAFLEFSSDKLKYDKTIISKVSSELRIDRTKKSSLASDGKLVVSAEKLQNNSLANINLSQLQGNMEFNLSANSNKILNRQINFNSNNGSFAITPEFEGNFGKLNVIWDYPNLYNGNAENFSLRSKNFSLSAPKAIGSLAMNSLNGNFTIINGIYSDNQPINFCINFDWSKLFSNQLIGLSNTSLKFGNIDIESLSGLLQLNLLQKKVELTSGIKNFKFKGYNFESLQSMILWDNQNISIKQLSGISGNGKIELSEKSNDKNLIFNCTAINYAELCNILNLPIDFISGNGKGEITFEKVGNNYKLNKIALQSTKNCNIKMNKFNQFAETDNSVKSEFAVMALADLNSTYCDVLINFNSDNTADITINATGRPAKLLPFEFDVGSGELKKVNYSFFNLESTIKLKYKAVRF